MKRSYFDILQEVKSLSKSESYTLEEAGVKILRDYRIHYRIKPASITLYALCETKNFRGLAKIECKLQEEELNEFDYTKLRFANINVIPIDSLEDAR